MPFYHRVIWVLPIVASSTIRSERSSAARASAVGNSLVYFDATPTCAVRVLVKKHLWSGFHSRSVPLHLDLLLWNAGSHLRVVIVTTCDLRLAILPGTYYRTGFRPNPFLIPDQRECYRSQLVPAQHVPVKINHILLM